MIVVTMMVRLFVSVILFRAAMHKMRDYKSFQVELGAYQLLPESLLSFTTFALIFTEALSSVSLLNNEWILPALIAAILFLIYALAMTINLFKGRTNIDCGCAGALGIKKTISWSLVIRNLVLAALALTCAAPVIARSMGVLDIFMILAGAAISFFIYEAFEQVIANAQSYQRWQTQQQLKN